MNRRTYKVIIERLRYFADNHDIINRFSHGQIDLSDLGKDTPYPYMHVVPESFDTAIGTVTYNFTVFFFDMPRDKSDKAEYQAEALSDCSQLALDLLATINGNPNLFGAEVDLLDIQGSITPFMEEMKHVLTGVTLSLGIVVPYDYDWCTVPGSYAPGGSGSGGSGSSGTQFEDSLVMVGGVVTFVNDEDAPGNRQYYGTNGAGAKGWYDLPTGGGAVNNVNGQTGDVELDAGDVGADPAGTAAGLVATEASAREEGDTTNAEAVDTERTNRINADTTLTNNLNSHVGNTSNPHSVTKAQVGLSNVPNTDATNASNISSGTLDITRIADDSVTLAKLADIAAATILGNNTGGAANPIALSAAQVRTMLQVVTRLTATSDVTNDTTNLAAITGLTFDHVAGDKFFYMGWIAISVPTSSTGARLAPSTTGSGTFLHDVDYPTTGTSRVLSNSNTATQTPGTPSGTTAFAIGIYRIVGYFTSTGDGTFSLQFASETGGVVATAIAHWTHMRYEKLN